VWTSPDGFSWSRSILGEAGYGGPASLLYGVTVGGPGLVAVGYEFSMDGEGGGVIWTSPDGFSWSRLADDEAISDGGSLFGVVAGGPGLVAVGGDWQGGDVVPAVWTSSDGLVWSRVPHDESVFGSGGMMWSVTAGGPGLVAIGGAPPYVAASAAVWISPDGFTWSQSQVPALSSDVSGSGGGSAMMAAAAGGPGLVGVGWEGRAGWGLVPVGDYGSEVNAAVWVSPPPGWRLPEYSRTLAHPRCVEVA
jgi:hypothetical protein